MTPADFLALCESLRKLGATSVQAGELRAEFLGPVVPMKSRSSSGLPRTLTPEQEAESLRIARANELSRT